MSRRVVLAAVLAVVFAVVFALVAPRQAQADWQVHRQDGRALRERAERALREQPDDDAVARRLVQITGAGERRALVARFRASTQAGGYAAWAAYARLLLATGDARGAAAAFAEALRAQPGAAAALVGRAAALTAIGATDEAMAAYDEALRGERRTPPRRRLIEAELAILAARGASAESAAPPDLARTVELRRELAALDPDRDGGAARLADALERAGRPVEAATALEARLAPGRAVDKLSLALRAARLRLAAGSAADATALAARLGELAGQLPAADTERRREVWTVAFAAARRGGSSSALAAALGRLGDRAGAAEWDLLGQVRDELGDLEGALAATRAAAVRAPRDPDVARRLVALLDRLGREEEATGESAALARRIPGNSRLTVDLVDRQMQHGRRAEANAALDAATVRFAHDRGALLELATVASRWGDDQRALAAWQRLVRLDPDNEVAIVGLGEAQFQRGHKDEARRTWAALRDRQHGSAAGRLRFAEVLLEHDFVVDATAEARRAQALDANDPAPHRLLAQVFEREKKIDDAVTEWNAVLALAGAKPAVEATDSDGRPAKPTADDGRRAKPAAAGERLALAREARVRLLGLYARQGRGRLDGQIRKLADAAKAHPEDAEATLFLAEAQERAGDATGAIATLRALVARRVGPVGRTGAGDVAAEAAFSLVHLLKRTGQLDEATTRLQEVARGATGRAREAELQLAELALARYDTTEALAHAARAATGADGPMLARIAELEARAGADARAVASYRQAVTHGAGPVATLALVRLLERSGDDAAAAGALDDLFRLPDDDEAVAEAGRLAIDLGELAGTLPDLEQRLAERLAARDTPARRRLLVTLLRRLLPPLYRDPGADAVRARVAPHALRALLDLLTNPDQPPDANAIELTGMLGNADATPALARLVSSFVASPTAAAVAAAPAGGRQVGEPRISAETRLAAVIALGRLGDLRGRVALERLAATVDPNLRAASIWALGRTSAERVRPLLLVASQDRRPEVAIAACLGLGRLGDDAAVATLSRIATDDRGPAGVRRAAIVALGRTRNHRTTATLFGLVDGGDEDLARAAALALAWSRDPDATPGLLARALLPGSFALADAGAPLAALDAIRIDASPPDEARALPPARLDLEGALDELLAPPPRGDLTPLLRAHAASLEEILARALAHEGRERGEALAALDGPGDGLRLGALAAAEDDAGAPDAQAALREIVGPLADRLAALLDGTDAETRAAALRVLARLGDERVTAARLAAAVRDASPALAAAAVFAAAQLGRARPGMAPMLAAALAPALSDESWRCRLAAVEALTALGPAGLPVLDRARADRNSIIRAAAEQAHRRPSD